jgi:hypothetical protein
MMPVVAHIILPVIYQSSTGRRQPAIAVDKNS